MKSLQKKKISTTKKQALAKEGANVVITDMDAMIPLLQENVNLNQLGSIAKVEQLTW